MEGATPEEIADAKADPESEMNRVDETEGATSEITQILVNDSVAETDALTLGIDVSKYQGTIDWKKVADSGVEFAMIRVGYRTQNTGEIIADPNAKYNMQEATSNGIKIGVYFFSTAISEEEAREEAEWVKDYIAQYAITYPVAYNCEGYDNADSRQVGLGKVERTSFAKAFLDTVYEAGYTPMFYASKGELSNDTAWETSYLQKHYKMWVSWYPAAPYPETSVADYSGDLAMWQYTNNGHVDGIEKPVDVDVAYFGYEASANAHDETAPEAAEADVEALMHFEAVEESVTAKDATNLRDIPSQGEESTVQYTLKNGEVVTRTGISDSGWSRVEYDGQTLYAVSNYLTTDLSVKKPDPQPTQPPAEDDGIKTVFTECNEQVSPKIEVNLRTLPSVTNPDSQVVVKLKYGKVVTRTGINTDLGWSRVEYDGQTLYCVSSYVYVVESTE